MTGAAPHDGGSGETRGIIGDIISHHRHLAEEIFHHHGMHPFDAGIGHVLSHDDPPARDGNAAATPQAPAAAPVTTATLEEPVFDFSNARSALDRLELIGDDVLTMAEKFAATPEGTALMAAAHAILLAEDPALAATVTTIVGALVPKQAAPRPLAVEDAIAAAHAQDAASGDDPRTRSAS